MSASLVGSEMCIRDSVCKLSGGPPLVEQQGCWGELRTRRAESQLFYHCQLFGQLFCPCGGPRGTGPGGR
eukprot:5295216-Alexandrium_andersonii.AAC.1